MTFRRELLYAVEKASQVTKDFDLKNRIKEGYTRVDPALVAREADVTLMYRPLDRLLGGFIREESGCGILVNVARPRGLIHMTCAHELGHFFLDHDSATDEDIDLGPSASLIERQADYFAYSLLAPRWLLAKIMKAKRWSVQNFSRPSIVYQLSLRLGISYQAMVWSLSRLELISKEAAKELRKYQPKQLKEHALNGMAVQHSQEDVWIIDSYDQDRILEPGLGDQFVVDLPNHAGSGRLWSIDDLVSEGFTLQPQVVDATARPRPAPDEIIVDGGGETMRYSLSPPEQFASQEADDILSRQLPRRQLISLSEVTPWLAETKTYDSLSFRAHYETIVNGLSDLEKERRLALASSIG